MGRSHAVGSFCNNFSVAHNDSGEGATAGGEHILGGQGDGTAQKVRIRFGWHD
jgi:hypothetical protein